jgi:hypothetical protein
VDAALVGLVLVLAFAAASFVARNSDVWLHLAAGKRLLAGQYTPGTDPFSYSAADRAWVNHSWLVDAVSYLLYGGQGKALVIAKAVLVAVTFGLVIAIRRPRYPLWPWAAVACAAVLAAAPQFVLRPLVVSMFFLAVTLFLLFRVRHEPNSWRFPAAIGVTFWFWSNSDPWFFVGPLALALLVVGDLVQTKVLGDPQTPGLDPADEPLGRLPGAAALAKALGVGVLACMLNPHHVRVWELPFELVGAPGVEVDPRLRQLLYSPLNGDFYTSAGLGYNLNGLAYGLLLVAGAAVLGLGAGRVRGTHVALWVGFAGLSLLSISAIPFFALVAVPLVAAELNALGARAVLKGPGDPRSRVLLYASSFGRVACVLGVVALCVAAYPGWVHPDVSNPALARRVGWGVEPDPALARAADQFRQWRATDRLPAAARGVIANTELANYVAWFAPEEKVFINSRFNHHRRELADYVKLRTGLGLVGAADVRPNPADATDVLSGRGAEYLAIHGSPTDPAVLRLRADLATSALYRDWAAWTPWYLDGATTVFGWRTAGAAAPPPFSALRVEPGVLAFGPDVARVPEPDLRQPLPQLGWEGAFVQPSKAAPPGAAEALGWLRFRDGVVVRQALRESVAEASIAIPFTSSFPWHRFALRVVSPRLVPPLDPDAAGDAATLQAIPLLALRAARRGIAEAPDHPDAYYALYKVLSNPTLPLPLTEGERTLGQITALAQCLERLPKPDNFRRGQFVASPTEVGFQLAKLHLGRQLTNDGGGGKKPTRVFAGVPLDVRPLGDLVCQALFEERRGNTSNVVRLPTAVLGRREFAPSEAYRLLFGNTPWFLALDVAQNTLKTVQEYIPVEFAGETAEKVQMELQGIEEMRKEVETAMVLADDQYAPIRSRGAPLAEQVEAAINAGLPGKALDLLTDKNNDLEKEYKDRLPLALMKRIGLALALGRLEDANELVAYLDTPQMMAEFDRARLAPVFQALKYQKAVQGGQYLAAGELLEATEGGAVGLDRLMAGIDRAGVDIKLVAAPFFPMPPLVIGNALPLIAAYPPFDSVFGRVLQARNAQEAVSAQMQKDVQFFYRRGVLSLLEGDMDAARERFLQTQRKSPPGWRLPDYNQPQAAAYLQQIDAARQRAARP